MTDSATQIGNMDVAVPAAGDAISDGDNEIRQIKICAVNSFGAITGAVTATHTELNYNDITTLGEAEPNKTVTAGANAMVKSLLLDEATCKFADATDITKDLFFELTGAATTKTMTIASSHQDDRTLTLPDATDTLVGKATTDTFTNKTLTSPVINVTSDAEGDIYYRNGSGVFTRLAAGTAGQVLQTNGVAAPSWVGGASASYLGEITGGTTGQELGELTGIATTTNVITLLFKGVSVDTNTKGIQIEIGDSTGYAAVSEGTVGAITGGVYYSDGWTGGPADVRGPQGAGASRAFSGTITLTKQDSANVWMVSGNIGYGTVSDIAWTGGHIDNAAGVVDRIKITCESAANFDGGSVQVFERT